MSPPQTLHPQASRVPILPDPPKMNVRRIGIVARDYNLDLGNGYPDFSARLHNILGYLDDARCDTVLFSLYTFIPRTRFEVLARLNLRHVRWIGYEEYVHESERKRKAGVYVIGVSTRSGWQQHVVKQSFGSLSHKPAAAIRQFVQNEIPRQRILGNACLVICGESNGVKYRQAAKQVEDSFGLRQAIPHQVQVILNPVHDRMTRFEMMLKRRYLSAGGRWVISVWNKGRINSLGQIRDGSGPAWTVFHDGRRIQVPTIPNPWPVEIGILEIPPTPAP